MLRIRYNNGSYLEQEYILKNTSRIGLIVIIWLVVILAILTPTIHKAVRAEQSDITGYLATNDKIKKVPKDNLEDLLSDNIATTVIFVDPRNEDLNRQFFDYIRLSKGKTGINRTIYIYQEIYTSDFVKNLNLDTKDTIPVVFFEGTKKVKTYEVTKDTNLPKDFAKNIGKLSMGH